MDNKGKERIDNFFNLHLSGRQISTAELTRSAYKFTHYDICELVKGGYIERIDRGLYRPTQKYLNRENMLETLKRVAKSINSKDYDQAFKELVPSLAAKKTAYRKDNNLLLLLLSYCTELPKEYADIVKNLKITDLVNGEHSNHYSLAKYLLLGEVESGKEEYISSGNNHKREKVTLFDQIVRALVFRATHNYRLFWVEIHKLFAKRKYDEIVSAIRKDGEVRIINKWEIGILDVLRLREAALMFGVIPLVDQTESLIGNDLIKNGQLRKAITRFRPSEQTKASYKTTDPLRQNAVAKTVLCTLLSSTDKIIETLWIQEQAREKELFHLPVKTILGFIDCIHLIRSKNLDGADDAIKNVLKETGKEEFTSLLLDLLHKDIEEADENMTRTLRTLEWAISENRTLDAVYQKLGIISPEKRFVLEEQE